MAEYFNVTTNLGDAEIANAISTAIKLNITHIAFGDGGGSVPTPSKARTTLINEVHRQAVTKYERHPTNANWIVIETIIPSNVGGFTIREMGIIANNKLISHGSHASFEKVADPSGVSEYRLRFVQNITDASVISIILDQSLIFATQAWVEETYIKRAEIIDNLTTNDPEKPLSAGMGKKLQDDKLDANKRGEVGGVASLDENRKVPVLELPFASTTQQGVVQLVNNLTAGGTDKAATAEIVKLLYNIFSGDETHFKIPNPLRPDKPWIIQFFPVVLSGVTPKVFRTVAFPRTFPYAVARVFGSNVSSGQADTFATNCIENSLANFQISWSDASAGGNVGARILAIGY